MATAGKKRRSWGVSIPDEASVDPKTGQVLLPVTGANGRRKKVVLGKALDEEHMEPGTLCAYYYPKLWFAFHKVQQSPDRRRAGTFILLLELVIRTGLLPLLTSSFGATGRNALLDLVQYGLTTLFDISRDEQDSFFAGEPPSYSLKFRRSYEKRMQYHVHFSGQLLPDAWFLPFFEQEFGNGKMQGSRMPAFRVLAFRKDYLQLCAARGVDRVWLCPAPAGEEGVDGPFQARDSNQAACGRKHKEESTLWAVDAHNRAITWMRCRPMPAGSLDWQALDDILALLGEAHIGVEGIFLGCGPVDEDMLEQLRQRHLSYVARLEDDCSLSKRMYRQHRTIERDIRYLYEQPVLGLDGRDYTLLQNEDFEDEDDLPPFGDRHVPIPVWEKVVHGLATPESWPSGEREDSVALVFDPLEAVRQHKELLRAIRQEKTVVQEQIDVIHLLVTEKGIPPRTSTSPDAPPGEHQGWLMSGGRSAK